MTSLARIHPGQMMRTNEVHRVWVKPVALQGGGELAAYLVVHQQWRSPQSPCLLPSFGCGAAATSRGPV